MGKKDFPPQEKINQVSGKREKVMGWIKGTLHLVSCNTKLFIFVDKIRAKLDKRVQEDILYWIQSEENLEGGLYRS